MGSPSQRQRQRRRLRPRSRRTRPRRQPGKPKHHTSDARSQQAHYLDSHTGAEKQRRPRQEGFEARRNAASRRLTRVAPVEIQTALIREHYMQGEPSGTWDSATQAAMQRYQADQGWQSKTTPDSRALIKLGLGPSHDHLLNPESAMTTPAAPVAGDPKAGAKQIRVEDNLPQR